MKKCIVFVLVLVMVLSSCATAIKMARDVPQYKINRVNSSPEMDFIGFKIDTSILSTSSTSKTFAGLWGRDAYVFMSEYGQAKAISNTKSLRQLGYNLESNGVAKNKSDSYFGIYSLQEMELYKSDSRYVTFVEVAQSMLNFKDNRGTKI